MSHKEATRPLFNKDLVQHFLVHNLGINERDRYFTKYINHIVNAELGKSDSIIPTMYDKSHRNIKYKSDSERWLLREKIINELYNYTRLENDDKIKIKLGGAKPNSGISKNGEAFIIIGLPASGKSKIAAQLSEHFGAYIIDSDFAKRKLPEYSEHLYGASLVMEEARDITFGFNSTSNENNISSLYERCILDNYNIIIPRVGHDFQNIIKLAETLKSKNAYKVHLIFIQVPKDEATKRSLMRSIKTKRYIPLSSIFDDYGNKPDIGYWYMRSKYMNLFESFTMLTNNIPKNETPFIIDSVNTSPLSDLFVKNHNYKIY